MKVAPDDFDQHGGETARIGFACTRVAMPTFRGIVSAGDPTYVSGVSLATRQLSMPMRAIATLRTILWMVFARSASV